MTKGLILTLRYVAIIISLGLIVFFFILGFRFLSVGKSTAEFTEVKINQELYKAVSSPSEYSSEIPTEGTGRINPFSNY